MVAMLLVGVRISVAHIIGEGVMAMLGEGVVRIFLSNGTHIF